MFPATGSLCNQITSTTTFFALRARTFTNAVHTAILGCAGLLSLGLVAAATWFTNGPALYSTTRDFSVDLSIFIS